MILSAQSIRRRCVEHNPPLIDPFVERGVVRGMSFGLSAASYDIRVAEDVTIEPGRFVLASSMERFDIPPDVLIVAHDKSSWARHGLAVQNTIFDPGWRGYATLELTNHGRETLTIHRGDPLAQIVCHLLTEPTTMPYAGKYQDQEPGPQPARDDGQGDNKSKPFASASSVDHPPHYNAHASGIECIEITEHMNFCLGNVIKYVWRAGEKSFELEDLKKARWYLDREIARLEKRRHE